MTLIETGNGAGKAGVTFAEKGRWSWRHFGFVVWPITRAWCDCGWHLDLWGNKAAMAGRAVQKHWGDAHR